MEDVHDGIAVDTNQDQSDPDNDGDKDSMTMEEQLPSIESSVDPNEENEPSKDNEHSSMEPPSKPKNDKASTTSESPSTGSVNGHATTANSGRNEMRDEMRQESFTSIAESETPTVFPTQLSQVTTIDATQCSPSNDENPGTVGTDHEQTPHKALATTHTQESETPTVVGTQAMTQEWSQDQETDTGNMETQEE